MEGGEEAEGECHDEVTEEKHSEFTTKEDCEAAGHHWEDGWDDAYEEGAAFIGLHVEEEGDYGIALPAGVALHVLETGHDDHDHGGEEVFEWAGVFEMSDATHTWSMQKVDGAYADPSMWLVLIPTETHTEDTIHGLEDGVDALVDAGCTVVEDGETMANIASNGTCFELHVGTGDDSTYTIDTAGITNMAMFAQHVPIEFERDQHYLKDAAGEDIEPKAEEGAEGHAHAHGDEEIAFDPHSWLDPLAFSAQVEVVYTALSKAFPEHAEDFRSNADAYKAQLADLDEGFESAFGDSGTCSTNTVAANHNAYAYISQRYGVEFVNLHGIDPEGEPSPEAVAEVLERVEEDGITAIYVEEYTPNGALDSLIQQTVSDDLPNGLAVLTLYTMETTPSDSSDNYITLMTKNLDNLKVGLGC
jgi:ABC-type Zn uptake system ZnuABC Zn-binding protein ZnuA